MTRRCFRCDGVGCMECIPDMADYRVSQDISGQATRSVAETARAYEELMCECGHPVSAHDEEHGGYHHCRACCVPGALCIHTLRTIAEANADFTAAAPPRSEATACLRCTACGKTVTAETVRCEDGCGYTMEIIEP